MKVISFFTPNPDIATGYGTIGARLVDELQSAGYRVVWNEPNHCDVQLNWCHPNWATLSKSAPNIIYMAWESGLPQPGWKNILKRADSICVTSYQLQNWVKGWGFESTVVLHGIDSEWEPEPRPESGPLTFLEVSQPRARVDSQLAYDAFKKAFGDSRDYRLIMKSKGGSIVKYHAGIENIKTVTETLNIGELVGLYLQSHCLVHLSRCEGFSLVPFQQIASGGITLTTAETVPYKDYLLNETNLWFDEYIASDFFEHPGEVLRSATLDEVVDKMRATMLNYSELAPQAELIGKALREDFSWSEVIKPLIAEIERLT